MDTGEVAGVADSVVADSEGAAVVGSVASVEVVGSVAAVVARAGEVPVACEFRRTRVPNTSRFPIPVSRR